MDKLSLTNVSFFPLPLGVVEWTKNDYNYYYYYCCYYYYNIFKNLWYLLTFVLEVQSGFWAVAGAGN